MKAVKLLAHIFTATLLMSAHLCHGEKNEHTTAVWGSIQTRTQLDSGWRINFDLLPRHTLSNSTHRPSTTGFDQLFLIPAVGYQLNKSWNLMQGMALVRNYLPKEKGEYRFYQETNYSHTFDSQRSFSVRARLEERVFDDYSDRISYRGRTMLRYNLPLQPFSSSPLITKSALFVSNEWLWNLNSIAPNIQSGKEQNRFSIGISYQPEKTRRYEISYLNQHVFRPPPRADREGSVLHLSVTYFFAE